MSRAWLTDFPAGAEEWAGENGASIAAFHFGSMPEELQGTADTAFAPVQEALAAGRHLEPRALRFCRTPEESMALNEKRGVPHFLDVALFEAAVTHKTIDAMFEAIAAERDTAKRILRLKAGFELVVGLEPHDFDLCPPGEADFLPEPAGASSSN